MAIIRFTKKHCLILCDKGHLVEHYDLRDWAGSMTEAEVGEHQAGIKNRIDRITAKCDGYGHYNKEVRR